VFLLIASTIAYASHGNMAWRYKTDCCGAPKITNVISCGAFETLIIAPNDCCGQFRCGQGGF